MCQKRNLHGAEFSKSPGVYLGHLLIFFSSVQFSRSVVSNSLWPRGLGARQDSLSITNFQSLLKLMSIEEKAMANYSSTLAWKMLWTEEPGGLQSMGSQRVLSAYTQYICIYIHCIHIYRFVFIFFGHPKCILKRLLIG